MARKFITLLLLAASISVCAQWNELPPDAVCPDWQAEVPRPIHPDTALTKLYYKAWETAAGRVRRGPEGMVASPYLDENCYDDQIWIWDGCFMVMFSKYAPKAFPGKETLLNYYLPIHEGAPSPLRIHLRDNPPLFAWTELENYIFTADTAHIGYIERNRFLERHYDYYNNLTKGERNERLSPNPIHTRVHRDGEGQVIGFTSTGNSSGMDNTPRGREAGGWGEIMWVDAISQQALAARSIARLRELRDDAAGAEKWMAEYERLRNLINSTYWDSEDEFYYDVTIAEPHRPVRVATPASFWAMLAGVPDSLQAARMVEMLTDERHLGGERPWTSLSRSDADFDSITGNYWRGGIWLPIAYMGTKALESYGYTALADSLARKVVGLQARILENIEPHTIWETYSPVADEPSTEHGRRVRQEFCGWSALGPISLFIENILGFRHADGLHATLIWDLDPANGRHGIENLTFGPVTASLLFDPDTETVTVETDSPFTLLLNGRDIPVSSGHTQFAL